MCISLVLNCLELSRTWCLVSVSASNPTVSVSVSVSDPTVSVSVSVSSFMSRIQVCFRLTSYPFGTRQFYSAILYEVPNKIQFVRELWRPLLQEDKTFATRQFQKRQDFRFETVSKKSRNDLETETETETVGSETETETETAKNLSRDVSRPRQCLETIQL